MDDPQPSESAERTFAGRFTASGGVRQAVARGSSINAAFQVGLSGLGLVKGFAVAAFLTASEFGIWGIVLIVYGTLLMVFQGGISDKYIQQDEEDQELAFQKAFSLALVFALLCMVGIAALVPLFSLAYGRPEIIFPAILCTLAIPANALQAPIWAYYRQMRFLRQRTLLSIDPIVSFVITIGLAAAGAGYWSLVIGIIVGPWCVALACVLTTPFPMRFRWDSAAMREYASFSWPVIFYAMSGLVIAQGTLIVGSRELGLAAVGAIALTAQIVQFTDRVDQLITGALYPAICAVKDRSELLFESFVKSNRLTLMWGLPFGLGVALFADDLINFVLGDRWSGAIGLLQAFGVIAAVNHIGFNWAAFYRARGETRPMAVVSGVIVIAFLVGTIPLMIAYGLDGFAAGMAAQTVVGLIARAYYLNRLFAGFKPMLHLSRALAPSAPAVGAILLLRLLTDIDRSGAVAAGELILYVGLTLIATFLFERKLLAEVLVYLRTRGTTTAAPAVTS